MRERTTALSLLLLALIAPGCGGGRGGWDAYEAGRFEEAHAAFLEAGDDVTPAALYNRALAALAVGELRDAADVAERAAAEGEADVAARALFLRGNVAFARCELAEKQAATLEAEPFAFDIAIRFGESARNHWRDAAMTREDWPAARRNVERALLKIMTLERKKREAERRREKRSEPKPEPKPLPEPGKEEVEDEPEADGAIAELTPEEVLRLFERLDRKEREKVELRRQERREKMAAVEKDW
jgi:hypothetical protein